MYLCIEKTYKAMIDNDADEVVAVSLVGGEGVDKLGDEDFVLVDVAFGVRYRIGDEIVDDGQDGTKFQFRAIGDARVG